MDTHHSVSPESLAEILNNPVKIKARYDNVDIYRQLTGLRSIPKNKSYWTLCCDQSHENSEISILIKEGLIKEQQFFGVDKEFYFIEKNEKLFPKAHFFYGDWDDEIQNKQDVFHPGMIYFDSTKTINNIAFYRSVSIILQHPNCKKGTVLIANGMHNNPMNKNSTYSAEKFKDDIPRYVIDHIFAKWELNRVLTYNGTNTNMCGFVFYKKFN